MEPNETNSNQPQPIRTLLRKFQIPSTILESFKEVELSEEEIASALLKARMEKYELLQGEMERERKMNEYREAVRPWSTEETFKNAYATAEKLAGLTKKIYKMDEYILPVFNKLAQYFSGDSSCETKLEDAIFRNGFDMDKGIMVIGDVGVGKTDLLRSFARNKRMCFFPITANHIEQRCRQRGVEYWKTFTGFVPGHGRSVEYFYQPNVGWMFDDIGTEDVIKDYGNHLDPIEKIIHERYMLKDKIPFNSLVVTTNLSGELLEKRYGYRMRSRSREMFNIIKLSGTDRRV